MKLKLLHHKVRSWKNTANQQIMSNYYLKHDPEIIIINAHGINNPHRNVKLFQYSSYTKNKTLHAGVSIFIKNIPHTFFHKTSNSNILAATIQTIHGNLIIITLYRPPRDQYLPLMELKNYLEANIPILIAADAIIIFWP